MQSATRVILAVLLTVAASSCVSNTFTHTWKAPDARVLEPRGHKVAVVYITSEESGRRVAEDVLVRKLNERGAQGIATYSLIATSELGNMALVQARLAEAGAQGAIVMRVIDEKQEINVSAGGVAPYYGTFSSYWGYGWGYPYDPARVDTVLRVETLVYSLTPDELLWAGTSRTVNPGDLPDFVSQLADDVAKRLMQEGLLGGVK